MKVKIICIFVMMLLIVTALPATGIVNFKTTWFIKENKYSEPYQNTPTNSPSYITIKIVAKVHEVYDPDNLLGGAIKVNDTIKGKYTYDSGAADAEPDPKMGFYWYNSSPCGIEATAGGFVFKTDPNNVDFAIIIANNLSYPPYFFGDIYEITSSNNLNLSNGMPVTEITWILYDDTGTALSSDDLPTKAPVLSKWNQSLYGFFIFGFDTSYRYFVIQAEVTKATKSKARDAQFTTQPILIWLLERFPNMFPILRHLMKL